MGDIFADHAPVWRKLGYSPRPIAPGTKAPRIKNWQRPDSEINPNELNRWLTDYAIFGIGLLLGSLFPDGTVLGGLDIDDDDYVRVTRTLLRDPICGRIGARGILFFVRVKGATGYRELKIKSANGQPARKVGELLVANRLAVIPPTIHPDTKKPYRWVGRPLHEIAYSDLPLLEV